MDLFNLTFRVLTNISEKSITKVISNNLLETKKKQLLIINWYCHLFYVKENGENNFKKNKSKTFKKIDFALIEKQKENNTYQFVNMIINLMIKNCLQGDENHEYFKFFIE